MYLSLIDDYLSIYIYIYIYEGESKVLQYFYNMKHKLAALDAFAEVVKIVHIELAWYSA